MGSKGKARRRREANFKAAHGGTGELAPPPSSKDLGAVPSKLRRIMKFKSSDTPGGQFDGDIKAASVKSRNKHQAKELSRKKCGLEVSPAARPDGKSADELPIDKEATVTGEPLEGKTIPATSKRKRGEGELMELMERFKATPIRKGIREQRKKFLEEKKNKKRLKGMKYESILAAEHETIAFGDVVQAPPKLSFPAKAKLKSKEEREAEKPVSHERVRLKAIEAYRQRKAWAARPGTGPPPLQEGAGSLHSERSAIQI